MYRRSFFAALLGAPAAAASLKSPKQPPVTPVELADPAVVRQVRAELERAAEELRDTPDQAWLWEQAYATLGRVRVGDTILINPLVRRFPDSFIRRPPPELWTLNSALWWERTG
jgi:hypothetical protein